ncbi:hypothetical protein ACFSGX_02250 [Sphingomonas arantia]|uniref:Uncharacterized protein n=1 Tax=Sphingomonas arantia TaxID=1460676 RepID=A0ABW4TV62_9SPHN
MADRTGPIAALPRSLLHLRFLLDNDAAPDIVLFRDPAMRAALDAAFPGRTLDLGREQLPGRTPAGLLAARRANRAYYPHVRALIEQAGIRHLILFLEGEPLERFLLTLPSIEHVELWEDGLSHYVDLTHPLWYAARGAVQAAAGFHPRGILHRRIDRSRVLVRDRFAARNLRLLPPPPPAEHRAELLLIGSPLVEDRLIARPRFVRGLASVAAASPWPIRYLPHPREDRTRLATDLAPLAQVIVEPDAAGLMTHAARYGYAAYAAAVSTGLLDLDRPARSLFIPVLFGLNGMARTLRQWKANPVRVIATGEELRSVLMALEPSTPA